MVLSCRLDHVFPGKRQDSVLFGSRQIGMHDVKPNFPVGKTLDTPVIEKAEVPGVDNRVGSNLGSQFVYDSELAVSVTDEQESHLMVLGSLKIAIYLSQ
jgi:hypothetical protein